MDLPSENRKYKEKLPWQQVLSLSSANFSQAVMLTAPFTIGVFMVRDFQAAKYGGREVEVDEQVVGRLTGLLAGIFSFSSFLTAYAWGCASNYIGRKPVIVIGNAVSFVSILWFGLSGSYGTALAARAFGGFFNGILGAWKCMIGESTDVMLQGKFFGYMSLAWGLGCIAGPALGGAFSRPCSRLPHLAMCREGQLLRERPYFLACTAGSLTILGSLLLSVFLLEETLPQSLRDKGLMAALRRRRRLRERRERRQLLQQEQQMIQTGEDADVDSDSSSDMDSGVGMESQQKVRLHGVSRNGDGGQGRERWRWGRWRRQEMAVAATSSGRSHSNVPSDGQAAVAVMATEARAMERIKLLSDDKNQSSCCAAEPSLSTSPSSPCPYGRTQRHHRATATAQERSSEAVAATRPGRTPEPASDVGNLTVSDFSDGGVASTIIWEGIDEEECQRHSNNDNDNSKNKNNERGFRTSSLARLQGLLRLSSRTYIGVNPFARPFRRRSRSSSSETASSRGGAAIAFDATASTTCIEIPGCIDSLGGTGNCSTGIRRSDTWTEGADEFTGKEVVRGQDMANDGARTSSSEASSQQCTCCGSGSSGVICPALESIRETETRGPTGAVRGSVGGQGPDDADEETAVLISKCSYSDLPDRVPRPRNATEDLPLAASHNCYMAASAATVAATAVLVSPKTGSSSTPHPSSSSSSQPSPLLALNPEPKLHDDASASQRPGPAGNLVGSSSSCSCLPGKSCSNSTEEQTSTAFTEIATGRCNAQRRGGFPVGLMTLEHNEAEKLVQGVSCEGQQQQHQWRCPGKYLGDMEIQRRCVQGTRPEAPKLHICSTWERGCNDARGATEAGQDGSCGSNIGYTAAAAAAAATAVAATVSTDQSSRSPPLNPILIPKPTSTSTSSREGLHPQTLTATATTTNTTTVTVLPLLQPPTSGLSDIRCDDDQKGSQSLNPCWSSSSTSSHTHTPNNSRRRNHGGSGGGSDATGAGGCTLATLPEESSLHGGLAFLTVDSRVCPGGGRNQDQGPDQGTQAIMSEEPNSSGKPLPDQGRLEELMRREKAEPLKEEGGEKVKDKDKVVVVEGTEPKRLLPWFRYPQVVLTILGYGATALIFCAIDEVFPIFASAPRASGGLGMREAQIAPPLMFFGAVLMPYSLYGYPPLQCHVGTLRLTRWGLVASVVTCVMIPFVADLWTASAAFAQVFLYFAMVVKAFAQCSAFTGSIIAVNAAPSPEQLGAVNGVGQTLAALVRGVGPALGGLLWAISLGLQSRGQQFLTFAMIAAVAAANFGLYSFVKLPGMR